MDKAANAIATGKILRMNVSSIKIARAKRGVTPVLSACRPLHRRFAESGKASCVTAVN
jgi:hypothetical protein